MKKILNHENMCNYPLHQLLIEIYNPKYEIEKQINIHNNLWNENTNLKGKTDPVMISSKSKILLFGDPRPYISSASIYLEFLFLKWKQSKKFEQSIRDNQSCENRKMLRHVGTYNCFHN